jgi:RNA polymerase sigma-70 factor, ECF subfamily
MSTVRAFKVISDPLAQELEELFREHSRLVYRTAYSVTGRSQDAEDIVQNLFLNLLRKGCPPGLRSNPKAYLYRSAVNLSLNAVKSRRRHADASEIEDSGVVRDTTEQNHDTQKQLIHAMAQLHPSAVEMLILRYEHGYSDAEIGRLLGKSRGVVAVTLFRARARLKKLLSGGRL